MEILGYLFTGAASAAIIRLLDNLIVWMLNRKAAKNDKADEKEAAAKQAEDKWKAETEMSVQEVKDGLRIMMVGRIRTLGHQYLKDGEIDYDDRKYLNEMHRVYHESLGGDGDLDILMHSVNDLPLKNK